MKTRKGEGTEMNKEKRKERKKREEGKKREERNDEKRGEHTQHTTVLLFSE